MSAKLENFAISQSKLTVGSNSVWTVDSAWNPKPWLQNSSAANTCASEQEPIWILSVSWIGLVAVPRVREQLLGFLNGPSDPINHTTCVSAMMMPSLPSWLSGTCNQCNAIMTFCCLWHLWKMSDVLNLENLKMLFLVFEVKELSEAKGS